MEAVTGSVMAVSPPSAVYFMTVYTDANLLYEAGKKAIASSQWKHNSQMFEMNMLLEIAKLQQDLRDHNYAPQEGRRFTIRERGKVRRVTSIPTPDKTVNHLLCDNVLTPGLRPHLIHDNGASQKGKGVSFHRRRFEQHVREFYRRTGSNKGYILLGDFRNYYGSIKCDLARKNMIDLIGFTDEELEDETDWLLDLIFGSGTGLNIGGQPSQDAGVSFAHRIDTYVKTVEGQRYYGRYSDDFYCIHPDKEYLEGLKERIGREAEKIGLTVHPTKTYIAKLSDDFRHLQISYRLTESGKLVRRINPKAVTRERRKIKAYKRLQDAGRMAPDEVDNAFKGWMESNYKVMSRQQVVNLNNIFEQLFERRIAWKSSKLRYLTETRSTTSR